MSMHKACHKYSYYIRLAFGACKQYACIPINVITQKFELPDFITCRCIKRYLMAWQPVKALGLRL